MNKQDAITRLCALATEVATDKFKNSIASDCFCLERERPGIRVEDQVIEFIETAVREKIKEGAAV